MREEGTQIKITGPDCPECAGPTNGRPHTPRICVAILKWKLEESERERLIAEGTVEWVRKNPENARMLSTTPG